jgi:hypothetical protein
VRWQDDAACKGLAPLFDDAEPSVSHIMVCNDCPVRHHCLEESLTFTRERDFGIWGGLGRTSRNRIKRERSLQRKALVATAEWHRNLQAAGLGS